MTTNISLIFFFLVLTGKCLKKALFYLEAIINKGPGSENAARHEILPTPSWHELKNARGREGRFRE
jgi:hypothetical protein